jgi:hypothetical protein
VGRSRQIPAAVDVTMMIFARVEKPCACNVDGEARRSGSLPNVDLHRRKDVAHGLLAGPDNDALVNPARSSNLPVPNVKRGSSAGLRA